MHSRARLKLYLKIAAVLVVVKLVTGEQLNSTTSDADYGTGKSKPPEKVTTTEATSKSEPAATTTDLPVETETPIPATTPGELSSSTTTSSTSPATTKSTTTTTTTTSTSPLAPLVVNDDGNDQRNCSRFPESPYQPNYDKHSLIKKCCPIGELFDQTIDGHFRCVPGNNTLHVETIFAKFYGQNECIEDREEYQLHFNYAHNDVCLGNNQTFQYSEDEGDQLFVIQNGSLLVLGEYEMMQHMGVFDWYCVEVDTRSRLLAKVCDEVPQIVLRSTAVLIYIGMVLASVTLLFTCLAYAFVPQLNDAFGYLLAGHAGSFLVGLIMMTLAVCGDRCLGYDDTAVLKLFAHVFLMSSVYAFFFMNVYNYTYAAYYLPNGLEFDTKGKRDVFLFVGVLYLITIIPLFLPWRNSLIFHLILYIYYLAIVVVLYLSHRAIRSLADSKFVRFTVSQQHYQELTYTEALSAQPRINGDRLKDIRMVNRLCTVEAIFTFLCWLAYSSMQGHPASHQDVFRIGSAYAIVFQGLLVGVLFIGGRKKWTIIRECWNYSGSIDLRALEMEREMKTLDRKTTAPLL